MKRSANIIIVVLVLFTMLMTPFASNAVEETLYGTVCQKYITELNNNMVSIANIQNHHYGFYPYMHFPEKYVRIYPVVEDEIRIRKNKTDYYKLNESIDTMAEIKEVIYNNYTGKLADCIFNSFKNEKFFIERDGCVYSSGKMMTDYRIVMGWDDTLVWYLYGSEKYISDTMCTVVVDVCDFQDGDVYDGYCPVLNRETEIIRATARLVWSDEKGWRICGGSAYEYLVPGYVDENPATGESDIIVFVILGAISLAAVTVLAKKKRA